ncbi:hypothetical protein, partial [Bacillus anthracis]|uniref:hypothetical protein n=1 Tax=Bacillus anthracis TaxID=1392 RepID=UPI0012AD36D3
MEKSLEQFQYNWNNKTPQKSTDTYYATINNMYLDKYNNSIIDLNFNLGGFIDNYKTYKKEERDVEIELPYGVTFTGEPSKINSNKLKLYYYVKGDIRNAGYFYNITVDLLKGSNTGRILLRRAALNYYYLHLYMHNIKLNIDTNIYIKNYLTFKTGGNYID